MTITPLDLKLRQSERMTDFNDGGGRMSAVEVVDGLLNNVFSDLSDADGIRGNVSLRKIFMAVQTANTDTFLDPFFFLTDLPANANVSVCLFDTRSPTDERAQAQDAYESYRNIGVKSRYTLYGDHFVGQQTIQVFCRSEQPSPDIGDVLCLSVERDGYPPNKQFVAVREVARRQTVTFTDGSGDFVRDVLIITITTSLQYMFEGKQDPERYTFANDPPTLVRHTQISSAARYYGMKACTVAPQTGDTVIDVGSPYIPAVPSTQAETPLVDQLAGLASVAFVPASAVAALALSFSGSGGAGVGVTRYFGTPYVPGSLNITVGAIALRDDGNGGVVAVDPANVGWSGGADYQTGAFTISHEAGFSGSVTATATAAGMVVQQAYTRAINITAANRNISHVFQLIGRPSPGSVTLDYLALGKWIRLRDTGRGQLTGNADEGTATINYATGSVAATLGALPDVDTAIIVAYGSDLRARNSSGEISIPTPTYRQQLAHPGATPGTLVMTWVSGGVGKTASAAANGAITGDATGAIDGSTGIVEFTTAATPDPGEQFHYAYSYVDAGKVHSEVFTPTPAGHAVSVTLAHAADENSVVAQWSIAAPNPNGGQGWRRNYTVIDNGSGGFADAISGTNTINYATGDVVLTVD